MYWYTNIESLRAYGFGGFFTIQELRDCKLQCVPGNFGDMGVYAVVRTDSAVPVFLKASTGGRFKGRNPNVSDEALRKKWVSGAEIVYIGKAGAPGSAATLRSRLGQYLAFGAGHAIGHWGGRYLWHLPASENLVVCWKLTPDQVPREVEKELIREFTDAFGGRPFANLRD